MRGDSIVRVAGGIGAGIAGLLGAAMAGVWYQFLRRPLPRTRGEISVPGLEAPVEIRRDRWGAPHIHARTLHDLWFGQGFCHGQDRLWQIEIQRRVVAGRLAEFAGEEQLPVDRLMRTLGLQRLGDREESEIDPGLRAPLEAYCAGVNEAAAQADALPTEFQVLRLGWEPLRPAHILGGGKLFAFGMSTNWERELLRSEMVRELGIDMAARLEPHYPETVPLASQPGKHWEGNGAELLDQITRIREGIGLAREGAGGSNNWAVSAERSQTSGPLIAGDPHLIPSMPGLLYHSALYLGDRFLRGAMMAGLPGHFGAQNNDVAWTFTNVLADVQDLFLERIDGDRYLFEDEWRPLEVIEEEIEVRGRDTPVNHTVRVTHHGPLVNEALGAADEPPLALQWTALEDAALKNDALFRLLEPTSGAELVEMLGTLVMPVLNLAWADRHGHIGYKMVGRIPRRKGNCPDLPKPGWTGEFEWEGTVPYGENPEVTDPEAGYVVTANNRITDDDYPHHISSDFLDGMRARRIEQLLLAQDEHDLEDFARMQVDLYSIPGVETVRRLVRLHPPRQREINAIERLRSWDGHMTRDSVAATIYQAFTVRLAREFVRAAIRDRGLSDRYLDFAVNGFLDQMTSFWRWHAHLLRFWEEGDEELIGRSWDGLALESLRGALDDLEGRFGPDQESWRWGRVHPLHFPHALGEVNPLFDWIFNRSLELGGSQETVQQATFDPHRPFQAVWAPCWRIVADPVHPERSRWQAFTGQSGHPGSSHYDDLQQRWLAGETQPMAGEGPWQVLKLEPAA